MSSEFHITQLHLTGTFDFSRLLVSFMLAHVVVFGTLYW